MLLLKTSQMLMVTRLVASLISLSVVQASQGILKGCVSMLILMILWSILLGMSKNF